MRKSLSKLDLVIPIIGAVVLFAMLVGSTRYGLGLSPDSTAYLKAADGLLKGQGLAFASVQWPPLYPLVLAGFGYLGDGDIITSARVLHGLLIATNFVLTACLLVQCIRFRPALAYLVAFLISLHEVLIWVGFYVWSEPLLISFVLLDLLLIRFYLVEQSNKTHILEAALIGIATMAVMTRYVGINVALINAIVVFIFTKRSNVYKKLTVSGLQFAVPALLMIFWLAWHRAIDDSVAIERALQYPIIHQDKLIEGLQNFGRWLYPSSSKFDGLIPEWLLIVTGLLLLTLVVFEALPLIQRFLTIRQSQAVALPEANKLALFSACTALFTILYIFFLFFIMSCYDKKIFFDNRLLSPIFIPTILIVLARIARLKIKALKNTLLGCFVLILGCVYFYLRAWLLINYFDGVEINARSHANKTVYATIKEYSRSCQVYADEPWNIVLHFDTKVQWLPRQILFGTGFVNTFYDAEVQALKGKAQIILVEKSNDPIIQTLDSHQDFHRIYAQSDGIIWLNQTLDSKTCSKIAS
jgi:hypothetical protein